MKENIMSGNGRGAARTQSRSPPFLVIGLLVALAILGFNYWSLSSTNGTLSATNIDLQDQIRILTSKRLSEEQSKREVVRKYNLVEQRIATKDSDIKSLQEEVEAKKSDVEKAETAKKECETNLQTCETNNSGIQQQLGEVNAQLDELKKKDVPAQNCDSVCKEQTKKIYTEMFQKLGAQPMQQLINAGIDIGDDLKVQVQQAATGDNQQIQPPKQGEQLKQAQQDPITKDGQTDEAGKRLDTHVGLFDGIKEKVKQTLSQQNTSLPLHDKVKKTIDEGLQSLTKDSVKQGLQSLSDKISLHDILNQTQEGIKQGLKKSQELAGFVYGGEGGKLHESSNITEDIKTDKTDTLVGNNSNAESKTNDNPAVDGVKALDKNTDEMKTTAAQGIPPQDKTDGKDQPVAKTVKEADPAYDDEDDGDKGKVEENKELKFEPQKEDNSFDSLKKSLDVNTQK